MLGVLGHCSFSAFPFESFLGRLKCMLRKPNAPLSQVIRRLSERKGHRSACRSKYSAENIPKNEHKKGPLPYEYRGYSQFSDIQWRNLHFSIRDSDNCIRVDNEIGIIRNIIVSESSDVKFLYECFRVVTDFLIFRYHPQI